MLPGEFAIYGHRFRWADTECGCPPAERGPIALIRARDRFPSESIEWLGKGNGYIPDCGKLGDCSAYRFEGVAGFLFPRDGRFLKIFIEPGAEHHTLEFVMFRGVIPRLLHLRGTTSLHASAVAVDGGAVVFCGPSGAGKSTLAAALATRGFPLVSDDVVPLRPSASGQGVDAGPGLPELRLYPATAQRLGLAGRVAAPMEGQTKARWQPRRAPETPLPLRAIYLLEIDPQATRSRRATVLPLPRPEALLRLITNSYWVHPRETAALGNDMKCLGTLLRSVPVARLAYELSDSGFEAVEELIASSARVHA